MKEEDIELYNRLIQVLDHFGCDKNTSSFAKKLGVNSQNISNIYNRKTIPKLNLIAKIATKYPETVNYHWLLTGKGNMLPQGKLNPEEVPNALNDTFVNYKVEVEKKYANFLIALQEKDQKIIDLQEELNEVRQKMIDLLEQRLDEL